MTTKPTFQFDVKFLVSPYTKDKYSCMQFRNDQQILYLESLFHALKFDTVSQIAFARKTFGLLNIEYKCLLSVTHKTFC